MDVKKSINEVIKELETDVVKGLSSSEVEERLAKFGKNQLLEKKKKPWIIRFFEQFKDFLVIILLIAAVVSILVDPHEWIESLIIFIVVLLNAILGLVQESKAEKSLEALKKLSTPFVKVIRNTEMLSISSTDLVKGDIIIVEAGNFIPADCRLIEAVNLSVDESALTGESVPVHKIIEPIDKESISIGDMKNSLFSSTYATYGHGKAVVVKTGMETEIGKIASSLMDFKETKTPLQEKLDQIGKVIGILCVAICIVVFALEMIVQPNFIEAFKMAVALAVAAVPEGLAAIVTVILAIGVEKMVRQKAIVKKLPAVETLGAASVICSDKTGTLTQNKMTVLKIFHNELKDIDNSLTKEELEMLELFAMCTDAIVEETEDGIKEIGDPTETALVSAKQKYVKKPTFKGLKRVYDLSFDSARKMMSVVFEKKDGKYLVITKGAVDVLMNRSLNVDKMKILKATDEMASKALRVLAVAYKEMDFIPKDLDFSEVEKDLNFVGLVGMIDPARPEVKDSVALASKAGIRTIMITGDYVATAKAIASELNILREGDIALSSQELNALSDEELSNNIEKYSVYARVAPSDKVRIVKAWQENGQVVAMTGDGVNDSPALKQADIGCAMGITGTDVAKEAADVVLVDDNFKTIVTAVYYGRGIYANIKKVVRYLLSSNIGEVFTIFVASLLSVILAGVDFGIPLLAIHLLWVNLITDSLPAFALGAEDPEPDVMEHKPRSKNESFFAHGLGFSIVWQGIVIGSLTLIAYMIGHFTSPETYLGQTMAFMTLSSIQLFHSFNMKSEHSLFKTNILKNKYLVGAFIVGMALQFGICYIPFLNDIFKMVPLNFGQLMIVMGLSFSIIVIVEIIKAIKSKIVKE
ncbi:MAG: calcium-translocating P-type ATPase, PMCA-type [Bacilli bacterium]